MDLPSFAGGSSAPADTTVRPAIDPRREVASRAAPTPTAAPGTLLEPDGSCAGSGPPPAAEIAVGIGECDLVRLRGRPDDVLIGAGQGGREVTVLYNAPEGKTVYLFQGGKLARIVRS